MTIVLVTIGREPFIAKSYQHDTDRETPLVHPFIYLLTRYRNDGTSLSMDLKRFSSNFAKLLMFPGCSLPYLLVWSVLSCSSLTALHDTATVRSFDTRIEEAVGGLRDGGVVVCKVPQIMLRC